MMLCVVERYKVFGSVTVLWRIHRMEVFETVVVMACLCNGRNREIRVTIVVCYHLLERYDMQQPVHNFLSR